MLISGSPFLCLPTRATPNIPSLFDLFTLVKPRVQDDCRGAQSHFLDGTLWLRGSLLETNILLWWYCAVWLGLMAWHFLIKSHITLCFVSIIVAAGCRADSEVDTFVVNSRSFYSSGIISVASLKYFDGDIFLIITSTLNVISFQPQLLMTLVIINIILSIRVLRSDLILLDSTL